jgi:hypothetical protein
VSEHPILFSGPMVRAILEGRKTQTRRVQRMPGSFPSGCPYGQPGDLLWVRETFAKRYADAERDPTDGIMYRADGGCVIEPRWTPAIHMPRWASRLTLRITDVRVQRVQDINEEDVWSEGVICRCDVGQSEYDQCGLSPAEHFAKLWDSINAKRGYSWESNPFCWAISFERK